MNQKPSQKYAHLMSPGSHLPAFPCLQMSDFAVLIKQYNTVFFMC